MTRRIVIEAINESSEFVIQERNITLTEAQEADEIWVTSSARGIAPVTFLDNKKIGDGNVGLVWEKCSLLFDEIKFNLNF